MLNTRKSVTLEDLCDRIVPVSSTLSQRTYPTPYLGHDKDSFDVSEFILGSLFIGNVIEFF